MTTLKIKVTKEIILATSGCRVGPNVGKYCAIAVAVRDVFPRAYLEEKEIYPYGDNKPYEIKLPTKARNFIQKFDMANKKERLRMKPIEFEIRIPDAVTNKINIDEVRPLLVNHPTLELMPS